MTKGKKYPNDKHCINRSSKIDPSLRDEKPGVYSTLVWIGMTVGCQNWVQRADFFAQVRFTELEIFYILMAL